MEGLWYPLGSRELRLHAVLILWGSLDQTVIRCHWKKSHILKLEMWLLTQQHRWPHFQGNCIFSSWLSYAFYFSHLVSSIQFMYSVFILAHMVSLHHLHLFGFPLFYRPKQLLYNTCMLITDKVTYCMTTFDLHCYCYCRVVRLLYFTAKTREFKCVGGKPGRKDERERKIQKSL